MGTRWCRKAGGLIFLCVATAITSGAQTLTTLVNFDNTNGANPKAGLVQGIDGNLYGTTAMGGNGYYSGTAFKISPAGALTTLYNFTCLPGNCAAGGNPAAPLALGRDGNLYGTTANDTDSSGTAFKLAHGALTTIYTFCTQPNCADGFSPDGGLQLGNDGNLYGVNEFGGAMIGDSCFTGCGVVYKLIPGGAETTLYQFCNHTGSCTDGFYPMGALALGRDGNFYGATIGGGTYSGGLIFKMTPGGTVTTLYSFCAQTNCPDGQEPQGGLVQGRDGNFYGVTVGGGANGSYGTIFKITPGGALTTLYSFCAQPNCADGTYPVSGLVLGTDGDFYGAAYAGGPSNNGTLFKITAGGALTILHSFNGTDGEAPEALFQATNGVLYGTTVGGGSNGYGTIFSLDVGLRAFVEVVPSAGRVGERVLILGSALTGATSVTFNGTPASFTVGSRTLIKATVPAGTTSGKIDVTLPETTLTSSVPFQVLP